MCLLYPRHFHRSAALIHDDGSRIGGEYFMDQAVREAWEAGVTLVVLYVAQSTLYYSPHMFAIDRFAFAAGVR